jgi:hypothetical protein
LARLPQRLRNLTGLFLAAIVAASMWFYVLGILRAHQIADSAERKIPRGNLSDLYPRWLGARELLLHRQNPYSLEVTLQIQEGYYGRRLDPSRPNDPKDQQGFAYPVYVVFLLAPLIHLPFDQVQILFHWLLIVITAGTVCLWLRVPRWRLPPVTIVTAVLLTIGSFPAVQGIRLQQLTLLVAALLAAGAACVASGFLFCGGALLALATIKPQLAWLLCAWLLIWALSDWRGRRRFLYGFGLVMTFLFVGAEAVLPGWLWMFARALAQYHRYTQNQSVLDQLVPWGPAGKILALFAVIVCLPSLWKLRTAKIGSREFGHAVALLMALTILIVPMYAPYNQVLLLPVILLLLKERKDFFARARWRRMAFAIAVLIVVWQWFASIGLLLVYFLLSPEQALQGWVWPIFGTFALPVWIFALIFAHLWAQRSSWNQTAQSSG